jgi:hypothetical protein
MSFPRPEHSPHSTLSGSDRIGGHRAAADFPTPIVLATLRFNEFWESAAELFANSLSDFLKIPVGSLASDCPGLAS